MKEREFTVILEELRSEFRAYGEGLSALREKVDGIFEMTGKNTEDISTIRIDIRVIKNDMKMFDKRLSMLETKNWN